MNESSMVRLNTRLCGVWSSCPRGAMVLPHQQQAAQGAALTALSLHRTARGGASGRGVSGSADSGSVALRGVYDDRA